MRRAIDEQSRGKEKDDDEEARKRRWRFAEARDVAARGATVLAAMLATSAMPAFARTPFDPEPRLCANGVAQTYGSDLAANAADALGAFCYLPIKKELGKGR